MKKLNIKLHVLLYVFLILLSCSVFGDTLFSTCTPFIGVDEVGNVSARIVGNYTTNVSINFSDSPSTKYYLNYEASSDIWWISITGNTSSNIYATITATNSTDNISSDSCLTKFRIPYYITLKFYQGVNGSTKGQRPYESLFNYVYMYEESDDKYSNSLDYLSGITEIFAMVPGTGDFYDDNRFTYDQNIDTFFWDGYQAGQSTIKLYELSDHTINILGTDVVTNSASFYEFDKPTPSRDRWQTQVTTIDFNSTFGGEKKNATFSIYLQPWESNKSQFMMDIVKWICIFSLLAIIIGIEIGLGVPPAVIVYSITAYSVVLGGIGWAF
jgi:hypothetical protein